MSLCVMYRLLLDLIKDWIDGDVQDWGSCRMPAAPTVSGDAVALRTPACVPHVAHSRTTVVHNKYIIFKSFK